MSTGARTGKDLGRGKLKGLAAATAAALCMLIAPAAAGAITPTIVNSANGQWLETGAIGDNGGTSSDATISVLVNHDPGRRVTGLKVDDDYDGTDNTTSKTPKGVTLQQPTIVNGYDYSRVTLSYNAPTSNSGVDCNVITGGTQVATRNFRVRAVLDDGSETATASSTLRMIRYDCTSRDDFPVITQRSQSATSINVGDTVDFTYTADDSDSALTTNQTFGGLRYRLRRLSDNTTTTPVSTCTPGDNTQRTLPVTFPSRGRWVVEAELLNENSDCGVNPNPGAWWRLGSVDVNSPAASSPNVSLSIPRPQLNGNAVVTATVDDSADASQGGVAQDLEWDLDENTGNGVSGFEDVSLGHVASGLTLAQRQRTINTTGMSPGLHTVRVRVGDNGALGGADNIRRTKIATATYRVDSPPVAQGQTVGAEAGKAKAITLPATDADNDPLTYSIQTPPSHGTLTGSGPNRTYTPDADYAGADTIVWKVDDGFGGTATATVNIDVAPDTTLDGPSGPIDVSSAEFTFGSPTPGADFECKLDDGDWDDCDSPASLADLPDGEHTFRVRAVAAGNTDPTPAEKTFIVDTVDPDTTIDSGPVNWSTTAEPSFEFSSNEPGSSFECRVDGGDWASCASPFTTDSLGEGEHTFRVRATDPAGNTDPTPASRTFTVDTVAPDTTILSGPSGPTNTSNPQFTFSSNDGTAGFECRIDTGSFSPCNTPYTTPNLPDGPHTFEVRAVDPAGNPDATPASRAFTIDTVPPDTTIDVAPPAFTPDSTPTFEFSSTKDGTFQCRVDDGPYSPCESPHTTEELDEGPHTFRVRAVDGFGNVDATPAEASFTVDTIPPQTTIDSGPNGSVSNSTPTFAFSSDEPGSAFECRIDDGDFASCASPFTTAALGDGPHTFEVRAIDAAGNADPVPAARSFTVDTESPATSIDSAPSGTIGTDQATVAFSSPDPSARFECKLDDGEWEECVSPHRLLDLANGPHAFVVRAVDPAGNADADPPMAEFEVNTDVPTATIDSGPSGAVSSEDATFEFSADDPAATFECRLDAGDWAACSSPSVYSGLSDGSHTFRVRAIDALDHIGPVATRAWTVDTRGPVVTIERGPSGPTSNASPRFEFSADETDASFECRLDSGDWDDCEAEHELTGLGDGEHRLDVRATDLVGNTGPAATRTFTVDTVAPDTSITGGPSGSTASRSAAFTFTGSEPGSSFTCTLDGETTTCTSPRTYTGLDDGPHTFTVAARDAAGNVDPTPATRTWTVSGSDPPQTRITAGPSGTVLSRDVSFEFDSTSTSASFECSMDGGPFEACTSPKAYAGLAVGTHTFQVRALDGNGTDASPASRTFRIDSGGTREAGKAPKLTPRKGKVAWSKKPVVVATIACFDGPCRTTSATATLTVGKKKFALKVKAPAELAPGGMVDATVKIAGKAKKELLKKGKGKLAAALEVTAQGAPTARTTAALKLTAKKKKKG